MKTLMLRSTSAQPVIVRMKSNLVIICAWCGKVRDSGDAWHQVDPGQLEQRRCRLTHSICPDCAGKWFK